MKNLIFFAIVLAITASVGGCGQKTETTENIALSNDNTAEATELPAARTEEKTATDPDSKGAAAATPTEAVNTFAEGMKDKDAEKVKSVLTAESLKLMEQAAQSNNKMSFDEFIKSGEGAKVFSFEGEPSNEKIDGDKATVEVKSKGESAPVTLVKDDGGWKIAFDQMK